MNVILASESPDKKRLLEQAGISFATVPSNYEENMTLDMAPEELALELARGKAREVAATHPDAIIIATDVFVAFEGEIMCKAKDAADAKLMLSKYPGQELQILCGVTIINGAEEKSFLEIAYTKVRDDLSEAEIDGYIATGEPMEASGPFKHDSLGVNLMEGTRGEESTIIGLPLYPVLKILREYGVNPLCQQ